MSGFDRLARAYRWLEYLSFGHALERCRFAQLGAPSGPADPALPAARYRHALVLGDGDGRFTARLLAGNREIMVVAVDSSPAMLALLAARVRRAGDEDRLLCLCADAVELFASREGCKDASRVAPWRAAAAAATGEPGAASLPPGAERFDLVVTHFFLDCLSTAQVREVLRGVRPHLAPGATWIVSEFGTPAPWAAWIVRSLYLGFRLLAELRVTALPEYARVLREEHFTQTRQTLFLGGLLISSVWTLLQADTCGAGACEATSVQDAVSH